MPIASRRRGAYVLCMAARKPTAPAAPIQTTAAQAHELLLADIERQRADALRNAKREAEYMITKLQRVVEMIDAGCTPSPMMDGVDARSLAEQMAAAESASRALTDVRRWIKTINA